MTTEQPTPEAVEAAAKAIYNAGWDDGIPDTGYEWENADAAYDEQEPGTEGGVQDAYRTTAAHALAAAWPLLRAQIADELRELRPGLGWHPSREQESFQRGYDAAVAQLDRAAARGAGRG